jgi:hypothetical protein
MEAGSFEFPPDNLYVIEIELIFGAKVTASH